MAVNLLQRLPGDRPQRFTLPELSRRLEIPVNVLRVKIAEGFISCDSVNSPCPRVGRDAAAEFCMMLGLSTKRLD